MAVTFAEKFVRCYAENAVKKIAVTVDQETGVALLTFHGRHAQVDLRAMVLQEDAFRQLGIAVDEILGVPHDDDEGVT